MPTLVYETSELAIDAVGGEVDILLYAVSASSESHFNPGSHFCALPFSGGEIAKLSGPCEVAVREAIWV